MRIFFIATYVDRLRPHIKTEGFFFPFSKKSASTRSIFKLFLPVYTYPDIFENGVFEKIGVHMHVAFSNHFCLSTRIRTFLKTAFSKNRRPHVAKNTRLKKIYSLETVFRMLRFRLPKHCLRVDGSRVRRKKAPFSKLSGYVWTGPKMSQIYEHAKNIPEVE